VVEANQGLSTVPECRVRATRWVKAEVNASKAHRSKVTRQRTSRSIPVGMKGNERSLVLGKEGGPNTHRRKAQDPPDGIRISQDVTPSAAIVCQRPGESRA
jgi:hypothetical protein